MRVVTRKEALEIINGITNGQIFTVVFVKRSNGELRTMNCRKSVKKHQTGGSLAYSPNEKGLISVFDMQAKRLDGTKGDYRMFNYEGLKELRAGGELFKIN